MKIKTPGEWATFQPRWADLHNHNDVGYGVGSLSRALRLARQRIDVWAFTAHAYWHDIPDDPDSPEVQKHTTGFRRVRNQWPHVLSRLREASTSRFLALPAFEWHSTRCGDRHVLAVCPPAGFEGVMSPDELMAYATERRALLIPHHLAYPPGARGVNWGEVDDTLSPVAEIFSEHGCGEADNAPWPMDGHSMSPRSTQNTWIQGLNRGLRLGAVASTDNHDGCPAAYSEGLAGIWTDGVGAEHVLDALRRRRCFAVTGDRISLDWSMAGTPMGGSLEGRPGKSVALACDVRGWDEIDLIDLVYNGTVYRRWTPTARADGNVSPIGGGARDGEDGRAIVRFRWGWGPMGGTGVYHWEGSLRLSRGMIHRVMPGFGSVPPASEPGGGDASDGLFEQESDTEISWSSRTSRRFAQTFDQLALEYEGPHQTQFTFTVSCRLETGECWIREFTVTKEQLSNGSVEVHMTEPPFTPTFQVLRSLSSAECRIGIRESLALPADGGDGWPVDTFYVRVRQKNGQMAWSSPIWLPKG